MTFISDRFSRRHVTDDPQFDAYLEAFINDEIDIDDLPPEPRQLATLLREMREHSRVLMRPPSPELAERMARGDFNDVHRAFDVPPLQSAEAIGRRNVNRFAKLRLRTKIAGGFAVGFTALTGVTAAGALPEAAQEQVESVVEAVTPIEFADRAEFGQETAEDARDGGVDGPEIAERAKEQGRGNAENPGDNSQRNEQRPDVPGEAADDAPRSDNASTERPAGAPTPNVPVGTPADDAPAGPPVDVPAGPVGNE